MKKMIIIAPASTIVGSKGLDKINRATEKLNKLGFEIELAPNVTSTSNFGFSATICERIEDFRFAFNSDSKLIMCATGGYDVNTIMHEFEKIDIKNKVLIGNSNNTIILNYLCDKMECYLGPNFQSLAQDGNDLSLLSLKERFINNNKKIIFNNKVIIRKEGKTEGISVGGNANALQRIIGTKFFPSFKNKILFLEFDSSEKFPADVKSVLWQFNELGIFDEINGLVLGNYSDDIYLYDLIKEFIEDKEYPVVETREFGHNTDKTLIPIGVKISINTEAEDIIV